MVQVNQTRKCLYCCKTKPEDEFEIEKRLADGTVVYRNRCKKCGNKQRRDRRKNDPVYREDYNARQRQYVRDNPRRWAGSNLSKYKKRSKSMKTPFDLTVDYLEKIYPKDGKCPITRKMFEVNDIGGGPTSATVDRIDPKKGYTIGNVAIISKWANNAKSTAKNMKELMELNKDVLSENAIRNFRKYFRDANKKLE